MRSSRRSPRTRSTTRARSSSCRSPRQTPYVRGSSYRQGCSLCLALVPTLRALLGRARAGWGGVGRSGRLCVVWLCVCERESGWKGVAFAVHRSGQGAQEGPRTLKCHPSHTPCRRVPLSLPSLLPSPEHAPQGPDQVFAQGGVELFPLDEDPRGGHRTQRRGEEA